MDGPFETGIRDSSSPLGQRIQLARANIEAGHLEFLSHCTTSLELIEFWF
jgi:hypothetical protein